MANLVVLGQVVGA